MMVDSDPIEDVNMDLSGVSPDDLARYMGDRYWRLNNLYSINNKSGDLVRFVMNDVQRHFYFNIHSFSVILKSRQLGFSTFIMILILDLSIFNSHTQSGVITQTRDLSKLLFDKKIKVAWMELDNFFKCGVVAINDSAEQLKLSNGSVISLGVTYRSGTLNGILHVSEFGDISNHRPDRAEEIITGAFPAVPLLEGGMRIVESTAKGIDNHFYDLCVSAMASGANPDILSPKLFFYPWYTDPTYTFEPPDGYEFSSDMVGYFRDLGVELTRGQMYWYCMQARTYGEKVFQEFPSTAKECFMASVEGALWTMDIIAPYRSSLPDDLVSIVVGVDPATTNNKDSDETGIIVAGVDSRGHGYVLEDVSGKMSPLDWAKMAVDLYYKWQADRIVAETNQGGDMVEATIRSVDSNVSYKGVRASKGKYARAEPVASLYERGLIHHVGSFRKLESQMVTWTVNSKASPDRVDALVWCFAHLLLQRKFHGARIEML